MNSFLCMPGLVAQYEDSAAGVLASPQALEFTYGPLLPPHLAKHGVNSSHSCSLMKEAV